MGLPLPASIPATPVPLLVDGLHRVLQKARFWIRLATLASALVGVAALYGAISGRLEWPVAALLVLVPYVPIAAGTRIENALRIIEDQVREHAYEAIRTEA